MNWYKKAQSDYSSRHDNYAVHHRPGDAVWIFDQNQNLHIDFPEEGGRVTHNRSFNTDGKTYMFKGRFNPQSKLVTIIDHKNFKSTDERHWKKQLEKKLYAEFGPEINIKYF